MAVPPKTPLPVDAVLPELLAALREGPAAVLEAPPGAGKTTRVPPALLDAFPRQVLVLEPRRIAARSSARRVAQERGEPPGQTVGYQIRFEQVGSARTRLWFLTEGILARRLLDDRALAGVSAVVLDEFHERHLPADVSLALLLRLQRTRPDLKLVVMSATLDAGALAQHLDCPVVRSEGRRFPVEVEYADPGPRRLDDAVAAAVRRVTAPGSEGHTLVFLPGAGEIRRAAQACDELARHRGLLVLPLHGELSPDEQDRALSPNPQRKLILATNVAETSVTVEGVRAVIDSGLARLAAHSPWTGLTTLAVARISRASAEQRAGRAGRTGPGLALRLYARHDFESRPDHHPPEIERLDLASTVLELRAAGLDPHALPWLDPPPQGALDAAEELLQRLGAVGKDGAVTPLGRACAALPVHPRLSRLAIEAARRGHARDGCLAAALLAERDPRDGREPSPTGPSDVLELLDRLEAARGGRARAAGLDAGAVRRIEQGERQLERALPPQAGAREPREPALLAAVLAGFPDRVARRRSEGGDEVLLSGGGSAQLARESAVRQAPLLVAVDADERREGGRSHTRVRLASAIEPEWLLDLFPERLRDEVELVFEPARRRVEAIARLRYDAVALEESRRPPDLSRPDEGARTAELLAQHADRAFDPAQTASLRARLELVARACPEAGLRRLSDGDEREALRRACEGRTSLDELAEADLEGALLEVAGGPSARGKLDRLAPASIVLPGGRRVRVEYAEGQPPAARSRLQDFFGMARTPALCDGRVPVTLHLLAPNGRAQQVTQDLAGFWERHYPAIRRELMRRYPRHAWPENGATAAPPAPRRP